jgi:hypothetical protein
MVLMYAGKRLISRKWIRVKFSKGTVSIIYLMCCYL